MARGYPDYSSAVGMSAEGKFLPLLSQGKVWFEDNFDFPLSKWKDDAGTSVVIVNPDLSGGVSYVYSGHGALHLTGEAGGELSCNRRFGGLPETNNLSIEVTFMFKTAADFENREDAFRIIYLSWRTGSKAKLAAISYNPRTDKLYYFNSVAAWTEIGTLDLYTTRWHFARLEIDPVANKYISLRIDSKTYNLKDILFYSADATTQVNTSINVGGYSDVGDTIELWIDNYTIRYGES